MDPEIHYLELSPPVPWRALRAEEYSPRVAGNIITLATMGSHDQDALAPSLESRLTRLTGDLVRVDIIQYRGAAGGTAYSALYYTWDGASWTRRNRNHHEVRERLARSDPRAR